MRYWIDKAQVIVRVNDAWNTFASANDASDLLRDFVVGQGLWRFISDSTTRHLYHRMIGRVWEGRTIQFPVRCDSPERRRDLAMTVVREHDLVKFESHLVRETARPGERLWQRDVQRTSELLLACSWCNRVEHEGAWLEVELAVAASGVLDSPTPPQLTHGICPDCVARIESTLR